MCEVMAKLLCRCSMLKSDDIRLKDAAAFFKWCEFCDLPEIEDANHMVIRCPAFQNVREHMFRDISTIVGGYAAYMPRTMDDLFNIAMGGYVAGLDLQTMMDIWLSCAYYISQMYDSRVKARKGVG